MNSTGNKNFKLEDRYKLFNKFNDSESIEIICNEQLKL